MLASKILAGANQTKAQFVGRVGAGVLGQSTAFTASISTLSGGIASSPAVGDLIVVFWTFSSTNGTDRTLVVTNNVGTNYTTRADLCPPGGGGASQRWAQFYVGTKFYTGADDNFIKMPNGSFSSDNGFIYEVFVFRNVDATTPVVISTATVANTILGDPPSVTSTKNGSLAVVAGAGASNNIAFGEYSAGTDNTVAQTGSQQDTYSSYLGVFLKRVALDSGNSYDPPQLTHSGIDSTNWTSSTATLLIRPK